MTILLTLAFPVWSDSGNISAQLIDELFPLLGDAAKEQLIADGELTRNMSTKEPLLLVPGQSLAEEIRRDLASIDFTVGVEVVNIIPSTHSDRSTDELLTMLLQMSTLAGLEYYSHSKDKMRALFKQSYTVTDREESRRIPDPVIEEIPAKGQFTVFQEDSVFGKNYNEIYYTAETDIIHTRTVNTSTFSWNFVPLIRPGNMHLHVVVYRTDECIIYYGNFGAHALRVNLFKESIHNSFYNRLVALYGWFENKL